MATQPSSITALKVPPHSIEAEQAVLGGLLIIGEDGFERVADRVHSDDFYRRDHQLIYRAIVALSDAGKPFDPITLRDYFKAHDLEEDVGGLEYLIELADATPSAANLGAYADIIRDKSVTRQLLKSSSVIAEICYNAQGRSSSELLDEAERNVFAIRERSERASGGFVAPGDAVKQAVDRIQELFEHDGSITGLPTGFKDFDAKTAGLQKSDLVIVAGRPAMGKTTFAMNIAENAAIRSGATVAVFSMEMAASQLTMRSLASLGHINQHRLRNGDLHDEDWPRISSAVNLINDSKLFIDDNPALSPMEVRARARRLKREHGLDLVVIDYLQLMQVPGNKENRATEISEISRSLKALAKELNVPVIALSQLNRALEQRPNKRPMMADLRESGAIEQDADLIVFIYRDEVYNEDSPHKGKAEIIIGKHRNGETGTVNLTFLGQYTRFENFAPDTHFAPPP